MENNSVQYFRGNGRVVVIGEKIFRNESTGLTYLCSPEVPGEITKTLNTKTFHPGPEWKPISGLNPNLENLEVGDVAAAWPPHIRPSGGCDRLIRIA